MSGALADFDQSAAFERQNGYTALWLDLAGRRAGLTSRLPEAVDRIDMTKWPAPIIRMFLGQLTPDAVMAAADSTDAKTRNGRKCEAAFYSGALALQNGAKEDATRQFRVAAESCPKTFNEWHAATAELKSLGQ